MSNTGQSKCVKWWSEDPKHNIIKLSSEDSTITVAPASVVIPSEEFVLKVEVAWLISGTSEGV